MHNGVKPHRQRICEPSEYPDVSNEPEDCVLLSMTEARSECYDHIFEGDGDCLKDKEPHRGARPVLKEHVVAAVVYEA